MIVWSFPASRLCAAFLRRQTLSPATGRRAAQVPRAGRYCPVFRNLDDFNTLGKGLCLGSDPIGCSDATREAPDLQSTGHSREIRKPLREAGRAA